MYDFDIQSTFPKNQHAFTPVIYNTNSVQYYCDHSLLYYSNLTITEMGKIELIFPSWNNQPQKSCAF